MLSDTSHQTVAAADDVKMLANAIVDTSLD